MKQTVLYEVAFNLLMVALMVAALIHAFGGDWDQATFDIAAALLLDRMDGK